MAASWSSSTSSHSPRIRTIAPTLRLNTEVLSISRRAHDKMKDADRADAPFVLRVRCPDGGEDEILARAVIDASGTWRTPNPLGASGVPALGEAVRQPSASPMASPMFSALPAARYAGKRVLVVGSGHSAFNVLLDLAELAQDDPSTAITWVVRRANVGQLFGGEQNDALARPWRTRCPRPAARRLGRGQAGLDARRSGSHGRRTAVFVAGEDGETIGPFDEVIGATGFRPNLDITRELRLGLDPATEAPDALAPLIDPNVHSCGTVPPHGAEELKHPEPNFFTVGMKSYGRAPTFLTLTGYEQVRSVVAALVGDWESARNVELVLPETGVCSSDADRGSDSSCGDSALEPSDAARVSEAQPLVSAASLVPRNVAVFAGHAVAADGRGWLSDGLPTCVAAYLSRRFGAIASIEPLSGGQSSAVVHRVRFDSTSVVVNRPVERREAHVYRRCGPFLTALVWRCRNSTGRSTAGS